MRLILFYDLPTITALDRKVMADFRKDIIKEGFFMLQESVYTKLVLNNTVMESVKNRIKHFLPKKGSVMLLVITEKQFSSMDIMVGDRNSTVIDEDARFVII